MEEADRKCLEDMGKCMVGGLVFYFGALGCLGALIYMQCQHQKARQQWIENRRDQGQYQGNQV